jgi:glycosyltransferase involved in cell wall biosynthesis
MKVAIIHYHLNPGGVTRIIQSQIRGLSLADGNLEISVLCGSNVTAADHQHADTLLHHSLSYQLPDNPQIDQLEEIRQIAGFIREHISTDTLLHCHNVNLGKNPALSAVIFQLAGEGYAMVNHCHDFPEDRPENIAFLEKVLTGKFGINLHKLLYPDYPRYHFVVLNSCDHQRVLKQGISEDRIHLLPNPVDLHKIAEDGNLAEVRQHIAEKLGLDPLKKICTYPVRAIRRKNIGEFLLLAALFEKEAAFVITQPPKNPVEFPGYNRWKDFCKIIRLDIKYEAGDAVNHEMVIGISDFCITTSFREGFGMVYLEPWIAGIPVIGRDLECITADLRQYGLVFPRLYKEIRIRSRSGLRDFKDLTPVEQEECIKGVRESGEEKEMLLSDNPFLHYLLGPVSDEIIIKNRQIIEENFTVGKYGERLLAIYKGISG